jgi:hypothetical protein
MFDYLLGTALLRAIFGSGCDGGLLQKRLGLICFVLLSLLAAGMGYFRSHWLEVQFAELAAEGVTTQGRIVDKVDGWNRNSAYYDFVVEYSTPDQARHRKTISTDATEYNSAHVGSPVTVRYVRSRPDTFYMVGREPKQAELNIMRYFFYGGFASFVVSLVALAMMWSGRKSDAPVLPSARPNLLRASAGPGLSRRQGFGKRG